MGGAQFGEHSASSYVPLSDNNGFGTNAAFIDKGNLPDGMADETRGAVLLDKHVQNVAPEGGWVEDHASKGETTMQQKVIMEARRQARRVFCRVRASQGDRLKGSRWLAGSLF